MGSYGRRLLILVCMVPSSCILAQTALPTVTFTCDFPGSDPSHYAIAVSSDGSASYVSNGRLSAQSEADSDELSQQQFRVSTATADRIFELTRRSRYFEGTVDSGKKNLASTGKKELAYKDAEKSTQADYNYSPMPAVQELTQLFQNLSATLEFGRRIEYDYRYQKLALDEELKHMEEMANRGSLGDVSVVASSLQKIAGDQSILNVVRARAQRLLTGAGARK